MNININLIIAPHDSKLQIKIKQKLQNEKDIRQSYLCHSSKQKSQPGDRNII